MRRSLIFLFAFFFGVIAFYTAALGANTIDSKTASLTNKFLANENSGFRENKGQLLDKNGNARHDILYYYNAPNIDIFLKKGGMSYVFRSYDKKLKDKKEIEKIQNSYPKRFYSPFDSLEYYNTILKTHRVDIEFIGANNTPEIVTEGISEDYDNYYGAGLPEDGLVFVHHYKKVTYKNIYPNIDLVYYFNDENSQLKNINYDFVVKPGGLVSNIKLAYNGMDSLFISNDGKLNVITESGSLAEHIPLSYQCDEIPAFAGMIENEAAKVHVNYELHNNVLSFSVGDYDKSKALVIDPRLKWGTYFGGWANDQSFAVTVDKTNNIVVTGILGYLMPQDPDSNNHRYTDPLGVKYFGDAFILKLDSTGSKKIWCIYYGMRENDTLVDFGSGIACFNSDNSIAVAGVTYDSIGMATPGAYQSNLRGLTDVWLARFDSNGVRKWATYFGGDSIEGYFGFGPNLFINHKGDILITGRTNSPNGIATTGAYKTVLINNMDAFIARFDSFGNLKWGTYYGMDSVADYGTAIVTDQFCNIYVTGLTYSAFGLATPGTYKLSNCDSHNSDAFVVKFDSAGTRIWGTYYGGCSNDWANDIITDNWGNVVITGSTGSVDSISTPSSMQPVYGGGISDAFLAKFDNNGKLLWGTYYGEDSLDVGLGLTLGKYRDIILTGISNSPAGISTPCTYKPDYIRGYNQFLAQFGPNGDIQWGTYYCDSTYGWQVGGDVVTLDKNGDIILVGGTGSLDGVATPRAYKTWIDTTHHWMPYPPGYFIIYFDAFIAKFGVFPFDLEAKSNTVEIQYASACLVAGPVRGPYCVGDEIYIPFTTFKDFDSGNVFTAKLSDKYGSFGSNATIIGTKPGTTSDTISGTIPVGLPFGTSYRVMVTASKPATVGVVNPFEITIGSGFAVDTVPGPFCAGETLDVPFSACLQFADSNVFTVQLSDYSGNFSSPVTIGSIKSKSSSLVTSTIPINTAPGTRYRIRVVASSPELTSDDNGTDITINALPSSDFTGPNEICFGKLNEYVALNTDPDLLNQWYVQNGEIAGTSDTSVFVKWFNTKNTKLKLIQKYSSTGCTDSIEKNIDIINIILPDSLGESPTCDNIEITYKAPQNEYLVDHRWIVTGGTIVNGETDSIVKVVWSQPGTGKLKLIINFTDDPDCKDSVGQTFTVKPSPVVTLDSLPTVCVNDNSFYLTGGNPKGGQYSGKGVYEDGLFYPDAAGAGTHTITYTFSGQNGCTVSKRGTLTVNPIPSKPVVTRQGNDLSSDYDYGNQWYYNNAKLPGDTSKILKPKKDGRYSVQVTDSNGCVSDMSDGYDYLVDVKDNVQSKLYRIYPNPAQDKLIIEVNSEAAEIIRYKLFNNLGESLVNSSFGNKGPGTIETINLKNLGSGVYYIEMELGQTDYYEKIIINK